MEAVTLEVELLSSVYGEDVSNPVDIAPDQLQICIQCRPRTGGHSALAFISAWLSIQFDKVAFPSKAPKVELQNTSGLGDDELAAVVQQIEDWQDQHYPLGDEEEAPSCLTLVEGVLDALDSINQNQRCSICLLPLLDWEAGKEVMALATRTACGHIYCFGCLSTWWIQHEEASKKRASETIGDLAHAATESRRVSLMEMRTRRLASLTSGERRLKDIDLDIEAAARELFDHQKQQEEGLGVYDKVGEQALKSRLTSLKEARKKARQDLGPLRSRLHAVERELEEVEQAIAQEIEASGGPPPRTIPCPVCRLSILHDSLPSEFKAMMSTKGLSSGAPSPCMDEQPQTIDDLPPETLSYVRGLQNKMRQLAEAREKRLADMALEGKGDGHTEASSFSDEAASAVQGPPLPPPPSSSGRWGNRGGQGPRGGGQPRSSSNRPKGGRSRTGMGSDHTIGATVSASDGDKANAPQHHHHQKHRGGGGGGRGGGGRSSGDHGGGGSEGSKRHRRRGHRGGRGGGGGGGGEGGLANGGPIDEAS